MAKQPIDQKRLAFAIEVTDRACARLAKRALAQQKARLVLELYDLFGSHLCTHDDIVEIPILSEKQLLEVFEQEQSERKAQKERERVLAE